MLVPMAEIAPERVLQATLEGRIAAPAASALKNGLAGMCRRCYAGTRCATDTNTEARMDLNRMRIATKLWLFIAVVLSLLRASPP